MVWIDITEWLVQTLEKKKHREIDIFHHRLQLPTYYTAVFRVVTQRSSPQKWAMYDFDFKVMTVCINT